MSRVGRPGGDERRHRPGFGDAFLENLPVLRFLVIEERIHVDRLVLLADVGVDADLPEERLHAEGARFVGNNRHDQIANLFVPQQLRQDPHEHHRRRGLAAFGALGELVEERIDRRVERFGARGAGRHEPAERLPAFAQVLELEAVVRRTIERCVRDGVV